MSDKPSLDITLMMNQAKELMDQGQLREALVLVMDALWRELDHLRATLAAIEESLPTLPGEESALPDFDWPDPPSRLLH